jgi:hypothetical protein
MSSARIWLVLALLVTTAAPASAQTITSTDWFAGPNAAGDPTYSGSVDQRATGSNTLSGWVVDTTAQGWSGIDDVQLFNGLMDVGGQMVAHPQIQVNRPDVANSLNNPYFAASGWSASVPTSAYGPGSVLYVYAHTPSKGWWYQQLSLNEPLVSFRAGPRLDIEQPTALATVHNNAPFTMHGTAYDPAAAGTQGTGVDRVQVYLNGDRQTGISIGDATLGQFDQFSAAAGFPNAGWTLQFQAGSWMDTVIDNTVVPMTVYAHSSVTGQETKMQVSVTVSIP